MRALYLLLVVYIVGVSCTSKLSHKDLRASLGIPEDAQSVLVFGQIAHLDWDWLNFFTTNVNNTPPDFQHIFQNDTTKSPQFTDRIFPIATNFLANPAYSYSVCEIGFLRGFAEDNPNLFSVMKNSGGFHIVGGGITSPDNLLPHGEAFIRDFVSGLRWMNSQNIPWTRKVWLPDDFGHDSQLPVLLSAMGVEAVTFSRLPGSCQGGANPTPRGFVSAHQILLDPSVGGIDFDWLANDGTSSTRTFYMPTHYCTGDSLNCPSLCYNYYGYGEYTSLEGARTCKIDTMPQTTNDHIQAYVNVRKNISATPYMFVEAGCDFSVPVPDLIKSLAKWNVEKYPQTGVFAISSTFSHYIDLTSTWLENNGGTLKKRNFHFSTPETVFRPTPLWMGFYASRPALKNFHYNTTRALIGCEILILTESLLGISNEISQENLDDLWDDFAPSTHHDFITGTANDYVTYGEQIPLLQRVHKAVMSTKNELLQNLASQVQSSPNQVLVFNQLGFSRSGLIEIPINLESNLPDELMKFGQISQNGKSLLLYAAAPSLGYSVISEGIPVSSGSRVSVKENFGKLDFVLTNEYLTAQISQNSNWGISDLTDLTTGKLVTNFGNMLQVWKDGGTNYQFGYETICGFAPFPDLSITPTGGKILENGPLRSVVSGDVLISSKFFSPVTLTITYTVISNEPILRINVTGRIPQNSSVFVEFKFPSEVNTISHGTPYHWDNKEPFPFGVVDNFKITFEATHNFVIPYNSVNSPFGAIYHASTPAWGILGNSLLGGILRNAPGNCSGLSGYDYLEHTVLYGIRVPSGILPPETSQPLRESLEFHTPLDAVLITHQNNNSRIPANFSLASSSSPSVITVAKKGTYDSSQTVFRIYQPSNQIPTVQIQFCQQLQNISKSANLISAVEDSVFGEIPLNGNSVNFISGNALSTVALKITA